MTTKLLCGIAYWLGRLAHARERLTCALKGHDRRIVPDTFTGERVWCVRCGNDL